MKIGLEKGKGALAGMMQNTVDFGKKAVNVAKENALAMAEKRKAEAIDKEIKKYNPLFPDQFENEGFHLPKVIVVADDAERREIEVCKGAIGWRSVENKTEILWIYDKEAERTGVQFVPSRQCNGIYHVDRFDPDRYILADQVFSRALDEKVAELERIAICLGAKKYVIDIQESSRNANQQQNKGSVGGLFKGIGMSSSKEENTTANDMTKNGYHTEVNLKGSCRTQRPTLKWFAHTDTILELIENRCNKGNAIKSKTVQITGSSVAAMSIDVASSIDIAANKMNVINGEKSMASKAASENHSTLYFYVEF